MESKGNEESVKAMTVIPAATLKVVTITDFGYENQYKSLQLPYKMTRTY